MAQTQRRLPKEKPESGAIPVGVSNRHVHLSAGDLEKLFGAGYELTKLKDLSQPGQFACKETVTVCGPKGAIEKVRILGPVRKASQIEILVGDCFKLGVEASGESSPAILRELRESPLSDRRVRFRRKTV